MQMDDLIEVTVKANAKKNELTEVSEGKYKVSLKAKADQGKANLELIKFLNQEFGKDILIVSGFTSKKKKLKLI